MYRGWPHTREVVKRSTSPSLRPVAYPYDEGGEWAGPGVYGAEWFPRPLVDAEIRDGLLIWQQRAIQDDEEIVTSTPELLEDLLRLVPAYPERVPRFVRKWGLIDVCDHGDGWLLPALHAEECLQKVWRTYWGNKQGGWGNKQGGWGNKQGGWGNKQGGWGNKQGGSQPAAFYFALSASAAGVLALAAGLAESERMADEIPDALVSPKHRWLEPIFDVPYRAADEWRRHLREGEFPSRARMNMWWLLQTTLNEWLTWARLRPQMFQDGQGLAFSLGAYGAFPALSVQLAAFVAGGKSIAQCSSCSSFYGPSRKPQAGRRKYCPGCRGASHLASKRDSKRRRKARSVTGSVTGSVTRSVEASPEG